MIEARCNRIENKQVQKNNSQGKQARWLGFSYPLLAGVKSEPKESNRQKKAKVKGGFLLYKRRKSLLK